MFSTLGNLGKFPIYGRKFGLYHKINQIDKERKMKKVLLFTLVLLLSAGMVFAGGSKEKGEGDGAGGGKQFIVIKSSSIGGSWYACGAAYAKLITDNTNFIAMNSASPGLTNESIKTMAEGKAQLALGEPLGAYAALKGNAPWDKPQNVRILFGIWPGVFNIVVNADSNINSLADLKGKSIATFVEGEPDGMAFMDLLSWAGVNEQNSRVYRIMKNQMTLLLRNLWKNIHTIHPHSSDPSSMFQMLSSSRVHISLCVSTLCQKIRLMNSQKYGGKTGTSCRKLCQATFHGSTEMTHRVDCQFQCTQVL